ncbi:MAG: transglycosylase SLT domain-containing protein [Myxococcota bacterium]|nr:transglycosylase SLT domain-containing protein [Myxococcota bacterium]
MNNSFAELAQKLLSFVAPHPLSGINYFAGLLALVGLISGCAGTGTGGMESEAGIDGERKPSATKPDTQIDSRTDKTAQPRFDVIPAGKALEAGDVDQAAERIAPAPVSPEARLIRARIAAVQGDNETAIRLYHQLTDAVPAFEMQRIIELSRALDAAGRHGEAASQIEGIIVSHSELPTSEHRSLLKKAALLWEKAGDRDQAIKRLEQALKDAPDGREKERLHLALGRLLLKANNRTRARKLLTPLAQKGRQAAIMTRAYQSLKKAGLAPRLSGQERLDRARHFFQLRAWEAASAAVAPLVSDKNREIRDDAQFLNARILFKKRRHYQEAVAALGPIATGRSIHSDDAQFLMARALSRLDRDAEAIAAYRKYARKTKKPGRAAEARFIAARLAFYLGRHGDALGAMEGLVGNGKKKKARSDLDANQRRTAHFLAGMSALLAGRFGRAVPHFTAASKGTENAEVLARNRYWLAVAEARVSPGKGRAAFEQICADDPTSWYARFSARRLEDMSVGIGPCEVSRVAVASQPYSPLPLDNVSALAGFLARAGLFREAANALRRQEKTDHASAPTRDWVYHYLQLEAPYYALRLAKRAFSWPPDAGDGWRAKAAYPTPYKGLVAVVEKQRQLPPGLIYAVARKESLFDPNAVSSAGALGMMQMMPHTYEVNRKRAGLPRRKNGEVPGPDASIRAAGFELESLLKTFDNSLPLALMAYNGGSRAVKRWLERSGDLPLDVFVEKAGFVQTRNYVKRVYQNLIRYRLLAGEPLPDLPKMANRIKNNNDVK